MKSLLYGVLFVALVGCGSKDGTAQNDTATTATTASETTTTEAPMTSATPAPEQEKPMSEYENKIVELHTELGDINIRFFPKVAPNHVRNFIDLAAKGFYDGTKFHRTIPGFVIQGGDPLTKTTDNPNAWGTGGSDKYVKAEFNPTPHKRGILSMARSSSPDSASSQFFICVADVPSLDNKYTVFGEVTKGMDVVDKIVNAPTVPGTDRPKNPVTINKAVVRDAKEDEKK